MTPPPLSHWRRSSVDISLSIKHEVSMYFTDQGYAWYNASTEVKFIAVYRDGELEPCDMIRIDPGHSRRVDDFRGVQGQRGDFVWLAASASVSNNGFDVQAAGGFSLGGVEASASLRLRYRDLPVVICDDYVVYEDLGYARVNVQTEHNTIETVYVYGDYDEGGDFVVNNDYGFSAYPTSVPEQRTSKAPLAVFGSGEEAEAPEERETWNAAAIKSLGESPWAWMAGALMCVAFLSPLSRRGRKSEGESQPEESTPVGSGE